MAEAQRYVVVDKKAKAVVGGPYLWDGKTDWTPPDEGDLMLESEATGKGYKHPEPEQTGEVGEPEQQ